jgi:hypothetical protein
LGWSPLNSISDLRHDVRECERPTNYSHQGFRFYDDSLVSGFGRPYRQEVATEGQGLGRSVHEVQVHHERIVPLTPECNFVAILREHQDRIDRVRRGGFSSRTDRGDEPTGVVRSQIQAVEWPVDFDSWRGGDRVGIGPIEPDSHRLEVSDVSRRGTSPRPKRHVSPVHEGRRFGSDVNENRIVREGGIGLQRWRGEKPVVRLGCRIGIETKNRKITAGGDDVDEDYEEPENVDGVDDMVGVRPHPFPSSTCLCLHQPIPTDITQAEKNLEPIEDFPEPPGLFRPRLGRAKSSSRRGREAAVARSSATG